MHIDEPWRDQPIGRVNRRACLRGGQASDGGNSIRSYSNVGPEPRITCAIHDATVLNQNIERRRRLSRLQGGGSCDPYDHER
jgi:hypothetical protein